MAEKDKQQPGLGGEEERQPVAEDVEPGSPLTDPAPVAVPSLIHKLGSLGPIEVVPPEATGSLLLSTRRGNKIKNWTILEHGPDRLDAAARQVKSKHPRAEHLAGTAAYNCAGLAFGSRRAWIDPGQVLWILDEDGFKLVGDPQRWSTGDIVVYKNGGKHVTHVAVVHTATVSNLTGEPVVRVISQWGRDGEYCHDWDDVNPRLGEPCGVYSQATMRYG